MPIGKQWKEKVKTYKDPISGISVTRLTSYLGHSSCLYFTDPFWIDQGRAFIFSSDRDGCSNLFRYDLQDGIVTQLTDFPMPDSPDSGLRRFGGYTWAKTNKHYFWNDRDLLELDLQTCRLRTAYRVDDGWSCLGVSVSVSADGRNLFFGQRKQSYIEKPAVGFDKPPEYLKTFEEPPLSRIVALAIEEGCARTLFEERSFITHVNANPVRPELLTYCHEGPWARIDQRIWGLDVGTGRTWKIRPQEGPNAAAIGHEYWFEDGIHIGYHGRRLPGEAVHFIGYCSYDNAVCVEYDFLPHSSHVGGRNADLFIVDGRPANVQPWFPSDRSPYIMLIRRRPGARAEEGAAGYEGPRVLALHRSTFNGQYAHPHASLAPDGRRVIFTSDMEGYAQIYLAEIGDFESLPEVPATTSWKVKA